MLVTAMEFKSNIGKYLSLVASEDIFITRNGKNMPGFPAISRTR